VQQEFAVAAGKKLITRYRICGANMSQYLYNKTAIKKEVDGIHQGPICKIKDIACGKLKNGLSYFTSWSDM